MSFVVDHIGPDGEHAADVQRVVEEPFRAPPAKRVQKNVSTAKRKQQPDKPAVHSTAPPALQSSSDTAIARAVSEALRLKRERQNGTIPEVVEPFPVGSRVEHSRHGAGTVVLVCFPRSLCNWMPPREPLSTCPDQS